jgi:hypothetical protein
MSKKEKISLILLTLVWLVVISLLRWSWQWSLAWLWLGALIGVFLLEIDQLFYLLIINPHELTSQRVQRLFQQRKIKEALLLINQTVAERDRMPLHNAFFQVILYVLCFFVVTSSTNLFGAGLVMGMAFHLLKDEVAYLLLKKEEKLKKWLFWQVENDISNQNQKIFVSVMALLFVILNLFLI